MAKVKLVNAKYSINRIAKWRRNLTISIPYISLALSIVAILKAYNVLF